MAADARWDEQDWQKVLEVTPSEIHDKNISTNDK
jgi:hypothetical protein